MLDLIYQFWPHLTVLAHLVIGVSTSTHAVLTKSDPRAAIGWVGIIWLTPLIGSLLYVMFGVNRIYRKAHTLRPVSLSRKPPYDPQSEGDRAALDTLLGEHHRHLANLVRLTGELTSRPLTGGNQITPLVAGEEAYPVMLQAINEAKHSLTLSTYIFDNDRAGQLFLRHLAEAVRREVQVRVLVDDVGLRYTWPPMARALRRAGIPVTKFLPTLVPWRLAYSNLRSHRKIMVADGQLGFTGGMNIRQGNWLEQPSKAPVRDIHFQLRGPIVAHLQEAFAHDWAFCTGEALVGEPWFFPLERVGGALARGLPDGPDEDFDKLRLTLLGAVGCARESLLIMTPYFLPDEALITALSVAAMRGVDVQIVLPRVNNLTLVQWASMSMLDPLIEAGCRVWLSPPPFEHTKLMVVDSLWTLFGSANWDARSLRLNFEFNVECYDRQLAGWGEEYIRGRICLSQPVTFEQLAERGFFTRLRGGVARLASPYL